MGHHYFSKIIISGITLIPCLLMAQVDFNKTPDDDLGNIGDKYQEYFFEALKQKGSYPSWIELFMQMG